jgi:ubiquinol-cytochrome c reductase cytochrome b subunit
MAHGYESGIIKMLPSGEFVEVHKEAPEDQAAVILSKAETKPLQRLQDDNGIPAPGSRSPLGHLRARLNRFWTFNSVPVESGHGQHAEIESGHGEHDEIEPGEEPAGVGAREGADSSH